MHEQVGEAEDFGEVFAANLDRGLPYLERSFRGRVLPLLQNYDRERGLGPLQVDAKAEPGQATARNHYVV